MALVPSTRYPAQTDASAAYPQGKARNAVTFQDGTGTPLERDWLNDIWGFLQSLLATAGITPSGAPDQVGASQYLEAVQAVADVATEAALERIDPIVLRLRRVGSNETFTDTASSLGVLRYFGVTPTLLIIKNGGADGVKRIYRDDDLAAAVGSGIVSIAGSIAGVAKGGGARIVAIGTGGNRCCFSTDVGASWTAGSDLGATPNTAGILYNTTHTRFMVAFSAGVNVAQDVDAASVWTNASTGLTSAQGGIAHFSNGDTLACGLDGLADVAISRSVNGGVSWAITSTVPNAGDYTAAGWIDGDGGATIYHVGAVAASTLRVCATTSAMAWALRATIATPQPMTSAPRILLCPDTGVLVIVYQCSGVVCAHVSRDGGFTWSEAAFYQTRPLAAFGLAGGRLFAAQGAILYSTDNLA